MIKNGKTGEPRLILYIHMGDRNIGHISPVIISEHLQSIVGPRGKRYTPFFDDVDAGIWHIPELAGFVFAIGDVLGLVFVEVDSSTTAHSLGALGVVFRRARRDNRANIKEEVWWLIIHEVFYFRLAPLRLFEALLENAVITPSILSPILGWHVHAV
jgi:hypothetical protein